MGIRSRLRVSSLAMTMGLVSVGASTSARGQAPTVDSSNLPLPGGRGSMLGQAPGAGGNPNGNAPSTGSILGSKPGVTTPHGIPTSISTPGSAPGPTDFQAPITAPKPEPITTSAVPLYGILEIPDVDDEGPADGLTLDRAIDITLARSLDLKAKFYEIPQAQADILQANLRANPLLYFDGQLLQYKGSPFSRSVPGGPSQYDLNVSYPIDFSRKRQARTLVASRAKKVLEAQYQDAVRQRVDDVYSAFADALAARQSVRYTRTSIGELERLEARTGDLYRKGSLAISDYNRVKIQLRTARIGLIDAEAAYRRTRLDLGSVMNLSRQEAAAIEVRGSINDDFPEPPPLETLRRQALDVRPDIVSYRLGVARASADVRLSKANAFNDVYILYQPYTWQDNTPYGLKSQLSWALGATVPLPVYNRNQGNIQRAKLNVVQTQIQLADLERQVGVDVEKALQEYEVTRREVDEIRREILPAAKQLRDEARRLLDAGETNVSTFINAQLEFNQVVKQYLDTAIRHRRSMLALNTAVGVRILP